MISFFSVPKPFVGHFDIIQRNAIESWLQLHFDEKPEIILIGNEKGVSEVCKEYGLIHIPNVSCNEFGTPLLSSIFEVAEKAATFQTLCFINTDIILLEGFEGALKKTLLRGKPFLILGERLNLPLTERINIANPEALKKLKLLVKTAGVPHGPGGADYFCFQKNAFSPIPNFAIGRPGYDHWLIWRALSRRINVIDSSFSILCIHQDHQRTYSSMQKNTVLGEDSTRQSVESIRNEKYLGIRRRKVHCVLNSSHVLFHGVFLPAISLRHLRGKWKTLIRRHPIYKKLEKPFQHYPFKLLLRFLPFSEPNPLSFNESMLEFFCKRFGVPLGQLKSSAFIEQYNLLFFKIYRFKKTTYHNLNVSLPVELRRTSLIYQECTSLKSWAITFLRSLFSI